MTRLWTALALVGLVLSAFLARRTWEDRAAAPARDLIVGDPRERAALGAREGWLGVELSGYEELVERDPDDLDAIRGRIRVAMHLGAVAVGQPQIGELVQAQIEAYLARRGQLDPDGSFLRSVLEDWTAARLRFPFDTMQGFYARVSVALYLAAIGDPRGAQELADFPSKGQFYSEFFPYVRRMHPAWRAVEPIVVHYLERGTLHARIEAGCTLLDYHALFGVGGDVRDRFLPDVRAAFREIRNLLRAGELDDGNTVAGERAILGMALLAHLGHEEERRVLGAMEVRHFPRHIDALRVARVVAGLDPLSARGPGSADFEALPAPLQEAWYQGVWYRLATLGASPEGPAPEERRRLLDLLDLGFAGRMQTIRGICLHALAVHGGAFGDEAVQRAVDERTALSVRAVVLSDEDLPRVRELLPALRVPTLDTPAIAIAGILAPPDKPPLQK